MLWSDILAILSPTPLCCISNTFLVGSRWSCIFVNLQPDVTNGGVFHRPCQSAELLVHRLELWSDAEDNLHAVFLRHLVG